MKTTEMQTHGVHLALTHTSDLSLAEISKPTTVQKLPVVQQPYLFCNCKLVPEYL